MSKEEINLNIDKYVNWNEIIDDFGLDTGDMSPDDWITLYNILERYIISNKPK